MKRVAGVEKAGLLNMLYVLHFSRTTINTVCVQQLLTLVHDGCLWLGGPILIDDMLIQRITTLPYRGVSPEDDFLGNSLEKMLVDQMKSDFQLIKRSRAYAISLMRDEVVWFATQILVGKIMRKCHEYELSALVISLAMKCSKGVQFNRAYYIFQEFLEYFREA